MWTDFNDPEIQHEMSRAVEANGKIRIYVLADPADNGIRYVGKTSRRLNTRVRQHMEGGSGSLAMKEWKRSLSERCAMPLARVIQTVSKEEWEFAERKWIAFFRRKGDLLNVHPGGKFRRGWKKALKRSREREEAASRCGPVRVIPREEILELERKIAPPRATFR